MRHLLCLAALMTGSAALALDAKAVAARTLGTSVMAVSALTTRQGDFIAVLSRAYVMGDVTVSLLKKVGTIYVVAWSAETRQAMDQTAPTIALADAKRDGSPELLWNYGAYGNAAGGQYFVLYDTGRKRTYTASISEIYGAPGANTVEYDPALLEPANAALLAFMVSKVEKNPAFPKPIAKDPDGDMIRAWTEKYGAINSGRVNFVSVQPLAAPSSWCGPASASQTARLTTGGLTYIARFKSGVFVLDPKKNTCALVYFPADTYQWVDQLKLSGNWIALRNRTTGKYLYFNPKTRVLGTTLPR
ncbi:hypothetical protein GO986_22300 [Deinococcus sp. HMF7620]|uniref:Uncharacterized protein n=1 Tax=Deinococcus arboris TaxID=2682977 RepID=A0A7C9I276_9DEIO|nr:hypothetical protein [Deinococcus arboris]MVN89470.1 hypothetical protein [Deinococcus arboris]